MVKYEIVEGGKEKKEAEKVLRVRLSVQNRNLQLESLTERGEHDMWLLTLKSNGRVYLHSGIDDGTGLDLDDHRRIKLDAREDD